MDIKKKLQTKEAKRIYDENEHRLIDDSCSSFVSLQNINKIYPNGLHAVHDFCLDVNEHDFIALVGPSGCGKSTTLRMIAGLEDISSGYLYINKVLSNYLSSKDRDIAMVFQSYALYPQLNVYDNIAFGLKMRHMDKKEIEARVFDVAKILDLGHYLDAKPKELSGGQMQRVALGRAIVRKAKLFLMDEPLSNLDAKLRVQMRSEIVRITQEVGATTIYVTHDQTEAMTMATRIVVMNHGYIQQVGEPMEVYENPANLFVATFIGSPAMNIIPAKFDGKSISIPGLNMPLAEEQFEKINSFYLKQAQIYQKTLENDAEGGEDILARYNSAQQKKRVQTEISVPKRKDSFFARLKETRSEKLSQSEKEKAISEERRLALSSALEEAKKHAISGGEIFLGIRPEHLYSADSDKPHQSNPITIAPNLIELLGGESIIHADYSGKEIVIKTEGGKANSTYDEKEVTMDLEKIHLFDPVSGLTII